MRRNTNEQSVSELSSMSVQQDAVIIENNAAHLSSELDGDKPWTIHGIAIGEGDVTRGQSGIRKKWPKEALKPAVDSLEGRSLVEDHDNSSRGVVGEVVAAKYKDDVGVLYEAELYDEELAERVKNGLLEVSIRGYHGDVENMAETEEGAKLVQRVKFDNLSIVPSGAAPSNTAEMGPSSELSPAECAEMMGIEVELSEHFNEGDLVMWEWSDGEAYGRVMDVYTEPGTEITRTIDGNEVTRTVEEDRAVYELEVWRDGDEEFSGTALKYGDKVNKWSDPPQMVEEASTHDGTPEWEEGQLVRWQVEPGLFGKIVHVDEKRHVVMVEVHDEMDGELQSTGFTISAGYSDLMPMKMDEEASEAEESVYAASLREHSERLSDGYIPTLSDGVLDAMDEAQLEEKLDEVYSEWNDHVNMSASELQSWSENPCSREASVDPQAVIKRNLRLLEKDKDEWTENDIQDAERTISFISRMSDEANKPESPKDGSNGCPTEWAISLLNWAYNPFDSMPEVPEEMDSMEPVELGYDVPEGAEEEGNPNKLDEEPERYPEGDDTPREDREGMHEFEEEEASDAAELADYSMHEPDWDGDHEGEWSTPNLEDFAEYYDFEAGTDFAELDEDTRSAIRNHFLIARGGFPAEDYGDLKLPVVEPNGELSLNALAAVKGGRGATAVDGLNSEMESKIMSWVNETAQSVFDEDWGDEEENSIGPADDADKPADVGNEAGENDDTVTVLSADSSIPVISKNEGTGNEPVSIVAAEENTGDSNMTDEITEEELSELRRKAEAYDELGGDGADPSEAVEELREEFQSDLDELKERTAILDEVDRSDVEALQETDEPYIMEREKYEQLEEDVDSVRSLYAEALSKRTGVPVERIEDKWTLEEMREDLEDELDEDEELDDELTPDPQGADPEEEELEEAAEVEEVGDDSPSEEAAEKQEEIRQRILS
jgi:hypothetical protein